jgi:hypothetical protein
LDSNELKFIVSLHDRATKQATALLAVLSRFNRNFSSNISIGITDKVTTPLRNLMNRLKLGGQGGSTTLFAPKTISNTTKAMQGIFKNSGDKKWYDGVSSSLQALSKKAVKFGDILVGAFAAGGAAIFVAGGIAIAAIGKQLISVNSQMEQFT